MTTVNTTTLARRFGVTTKALEKRLVKLGIVPAQEMVQPSGKRFVLWPADEAVQALEDYKANRTELRGGLRSKAPSPETVANESLKNEVQELKAMMQAMLAKMDKEA